MSDFDEIKRRILASQITSPDLKELLNSIKTSREPDECWQVQTRVVPHSDWIPMTGFTKAGIAQVRCDYWTEIMPERCFRIVCIRPSISISMSEAEKIKKAVTLAVKYGGIQGDHHKAWVIDQMVRALTGCPMIEKDAIDCNGTPYSFMDAGESQEYLEIVREAKIGEDGPETYTWETGIAP